MIVSRKDSEGSAGDKESGEGKLTDQSRAHGILVFSHTAEGLNLELGLLELADAHLATLKGQIAALLALWLGHVANRGVSERGRRGERAGAEDPARRSRRGGAQCSRED